MSTFAVDIVFIDYLEHPVWFRCDLGDKGLAFDRARRVRAAFNSHPKWLEMTSYLLDCEAIGIEEPQGRFVGPLSGLYRVQGAILQFLPWQSLVNPIGPTKWRKAVGLKGNASKEAVAEYVHGLFGDLVADWPQDACDAWCIAEATRLALT